MINKEMAMPNLSPSASSEEIWELLTCIRPISWFGFLNPQMVQYMQLSSPLNQTNPGHIIYICCLNRRTVSLQLESILKCCSHFCSDLSGYSFHLTAIVRKNKQGKEQFGNIPSPRIRKICINYSVCKKHSSCQFIFRYELRQLDLEKVYTCELRKTNALASLKTHIHSHEEKDCKRINS